MYIEVFCLFVRIEWAPKQIKEYRKAIYGANWNLSGSDVGY